MAQITVTLKVTVMESATDSRMLTFTFPGSVSVGEANEQIRERCHGEAAADMMLFRVTRRESTQITPVSHSSGFLRRKKEQKKEKEQQGMEQPPDPVGEWLKPNKTLEAYDLSTDDTLLFRKRHKVITVKTADASSKAVIVDLMRNVKDVLPTIGEKFGLEHTEEYALQWERTERWLLNSRPLTEQGDTNETFVLKKRFYVSDAQLDANSPVQLHLAYIQGRECVVSGMHPVTKMEAVQFAGLQAQAQYGIFNPATHKPGFLELSEFIPPMYLKNKDIESLVLNSWKGLGNMTMIEAKYKYHLLCMTLATYGKTMFSVQVNEAPKGKKPNLVPYKLALSATLIEQLSPDCKTVIRKHKYQHIKKWTYDDEATTPIVSFDFGLHEPSNPIVYITPQGEDIATLVGGYIDILVRINKSKTADEAMIGGQVAEIQSMGVAKGKVQVGTSITTVNANGSNELMQIQDIQSMQDVFRSYHVPSVKELGPPPVGFTLTLEQLSTQMDSSTASIQKLLNELQKAAAAHNGQELSNLSKNLAMLINNFLSDAQRAASMSKDVPHKQQLLNACVTLVQILDRYAEAVKLYEANPDAATLANVELAKRELENALEGVIVAMRSHQVEPENGALLLALAQNVAFSVKQMTEVAKKSAGGNAGVDSACKVAEENCSQLLDTVGMLGQYAADKDMRERIYVHMKRIKPSVADILQAVSQANPTAMPGVMSEMKNVDAELRTLQQALEETVIDLNSKMLPYLRAAHTVVYESAKVMSTPENVPQISSSASIIKDCVPVIIARAKEMNDEQCDSAKNGGYIAPTNLNTLVIARQIAIATKMLVQQSAPDAKVNGELVHKSGLALNQAVITLLGDEELLMHKVVLVDRAKLAAASVLRIAQRARDNVHDGKVPPERAEEFMQRARGAFDAVQQLLLAIRQAVGTEGDERVNINHLAEMSAMFCQGAAVNVIFPFNAEGGEYTELCTIAGRDVQSLLEETQRYRIVGRLADIEYATENFHAAEAVLQALLFSNDADRFRKSGTREEALAQLPTAASQFGNSLKSVAQAVKQSQNFIQPLRDLSKATQAIVCVARGLVTNSRFKHERSLLVDAARELTVDVGKLVEALKRFAREDTNGVVDAVASSIAGSVSALQRIVSYAQNEGGQLVLEESELTSKYDAELESRAEETLISVKEQVDEVLANMNKLSASLPPATDPRSTVNTAVVDSVSALVASTSTVVGAAYEAQNELVINLAQPTTRFAYARDPTLADALIRAARHVQMSIVDLTRGLSVDTIQTLSQQELASHAGEVSKSVEILASAVRAGTKAQSSSLVEATKTVADATQSLLEAAKMIEELPTEEEEDTDVENFGIDAYTLQEIKMQMRIAELEHLLEKARKKYDALMNTSLQKTQWNVV